MTYDVIIIGAGQAGLAAGYFLSKSKKSFLILDSTDRVGDSWRNRYDSLELFSPRALSRLPGMKLAGNQDKFPTKDEVADYLEQYAQNFKLPITFDTKVTKLEKKNNEFIITTNSKNLFVSTQVIIATGAHPIPFIPKLSDNLSKSVFQIHTEGYKNPSEIPAGQVIIIGAGNSGAQIAYELSRKRNTKLSTGHKLVFVPKQIFGKSLFWWFDHTGILSLLLSFKSSSAVGRFIHMRQGRLIIGTELKNAINKKQVILKPRLIGIEGNKLIFSDKSTVLANAIIWATGFKSDFNWIKIDGLFDNNGKPRHTRGVSNEQGLYFLGLPGLHNIGSGLFSGIGKDAEYLVSHITSSQ